VGKMIFNEKFAGLLLFGHPLYVSHKMILVKPPILAEKIFASAIWNVPNSKNRVYITFDDGPIPEITPWVLDTLAKHNAKATFFCIGDNVKKHPKVFKQVVKAGHSIGNHTFNHLKGWKTSNNDYYKNIKEADQLLHTKLFRPPYGKIKISQSKHLHDDFKIIMWDVLSMDYSKDISPDECLKNVIDNYTDGSIIVFHDSLKAEKNMKYVLPKLLEHLSENGFTSSSLPDNL
jgi:peptidoglycan/xylan/chitin deacetylase (PgdA/CDA1 family)